MNWALLCNSLMVASGVTLTVLVIGLCGAICLCSVGLGPRRVLVGLAMICLALPPFLVTNCWLDLLGQKGILRPWLPLNIYSLTGTVWVLSLLLWPATVLLVWGGLQKVDPIYLDVEPQLRGWPMIRWLLIPISRTALVQAALLTFVLALNNFAVPAILQTKVLPAELWVSFNTTFEYGTALALSWPLFLFPALLLAWWRCAPVTWPRIAGGLSPAVLRQRLGRLWLVVAWGVNIAILVLAVGAPLGQLLASSRTWIELPNAFAAGHSAVANSFVFATVAASVCGAAGLTLWRWRLGAVLWLPLLVPGVLLGIGLILIFNRPPLVAIYQSAAMVVVGLALRYAALSWIGVRWAVDSIDRALADFAKLNGASRWHMFRYVTWPQVAPEVAACWFVTYLLCLWDVETLVLIIPPGCETLALRIFNLLHYGHNVEVNALCVLLLGVALVPLALWVVGNSVRHKFSMAGSLLMLIVASGCGPGPAPGSHVDSRFFNKVQIIGSRGTALGQFNKPRSLTVDAQDNLYVVDMTGRVQKFSPEGVYVTSWQMPQTEKGKPKGMCRDGAGDIVVVEPHYCRVNHFSPEGKLIAQWGQSGTNSGELCLPRAVAVNTHGDLIVCEYTLVDRVQVFSAHGQTWKRTIGHSGRGEGEFNRPEGLGVDRENRIYVADSCNHRIQVFTEEGKLVRSYGHPGSGLGELSYPYHVQVDAAGFQFVAEFGNSRVQVFDQRGAPVEVIGGTGAAPGRFSNPWSVALDSFGNLYVADSQNHRVQKFLRKQPVARAPAPGAAAQAPPDGTSMAVGQPRT